MNITDELRAKLLAAKSKEEVTALARADGQELSQEDAARIWEEIAKTREQDGKELELDELDAVSGGKDRDWPTDGCAATVEPGSRCGSNDACWHFDVTYDHMPEKVCEKCGGYMYAGTGVYSTNGYICKNCKQTWTMGSPALPLNPPPPSFP